MSPRHWWLRSPNVGNSNNTRNVNTAGNVNNNNANNASGVSPDCVYSPFKVSLLKSRNQSITSKELLSRSVRTDK